MRMTILAALLLTLFACKNEQIAESSIDSQQETIIEKDEYISPKPNLEKGFPIKLFETKKSK